MKFQGIVLRIIVKILMSGPPTGELPGGVWRRPQGAVKRRRRGWLHTSKSPRKSLKRFLEISCFFKVFTTFRGPKILHGIAFFSPDDLTLFSTENLHQVLMRGSTGMWVFLFRNFGKYRKNFQIFLKKKYFFVELRAAWHRCHELKIFELTS